MHPAQAPCAVGGNEEAARLSGIPTQAVKLLAYGMSGLLSAVAGICQAVQEQQGDPEAGSTYELSAIAIVVMGGTSLNGGRGGMLFTLVGAMTIGYLEKILSINAVGARLSRGGDARTRCVGWSGVACLRRRRPLPA